MDDAVARAHTMGRYRPVASLLYLAGSNLMPLTAAATNTGNIDTTYANGPNFAKVDNVGFGLTLEF